VGQDENLTDSYNGKNVWEVKLINHVTNNRNITLNSNSLNYTVQCSVGYLKMFQPLKCKRHSLHQLEPTGRRLDKPSVYTLQYIFSITKIIRWTGTVKQAYAFTDDQLLSSCYSSKYSTNHIRMPHVSYILGATPMYDTHRVAQQKKEDPCIYFMSQSQTEELFTQS
jgi:hypothetical protein